HAHVTLYFEAFEALAMTVYLRVLPKYGLQGDWDGVREMFAKTVSALRDTTVKKQHEEINSLLGLPRDAVLRPAQKVELLIYCPGGSSPQGSDPPLIEDDDGDEANEFLIEDEESGELRVLVQTS
ncbi:unnamed protein product, partial [Polarella glacialis]